MAAEEVWWASQDSVSGKVRTTCNTIPPTNYGTLRMRYDGGQAPASHRCPRKPQLPGQAPASPGKPRQAPSSHRNLAAPCCSWERAGEGRQMQHDICAKGKRMRTSPSKNTMLRRLCEVVLGGASAVVHASVKCTGQIRSQVHAAPGRCRGARSTSEIARQGRPSRREAGVCKPLFNGKT